MSTDILNKNWWSKNWKWVFPTTGILSCIVLFFMMTGDATLRYGAVYLQPDLVENALLKAKKNEQVIEKIGALKSVDFLSLLEGEVAYSNNNNSVALTIGVKGTKGRAKMDIIANKTNENWSYQKITIRIKKPTKETIKILE
ncbi:cytochrome c oxidase assembly factor Coa1 family protein [Aquimarina sp. I32.4]|uniref:cytochrome c oxidase assembly factor Coa1 family protein n=1 Tax=Aquimarina sp. I32.4 TaxID=2053903 RepID=UPI000CDEB920|nr:cytochrome c oxidase assembly factor Coa1 family protein [Aquimarina sp. I32.4]